MAKKTSVAANSFGAGYELIGKFHRGKKIVNASRKYMHLETGDKVERKGNQVEFDPEENQHPYRQVVKVTS